MYDKYKIGLNVHSLQQQAGVPKSPCNCLSLSNDLILLMLSKLVRLMVGFYHSGTPLHIAAAPLSNNYRIYVTALTLTPFFTFPSTVTHPKC